MDRKTNLIQLKEIHKQSPKDFFNTGPFCGHKSSDTRLGKGAFGEVFIGYHPIDSYQVAIKYVKEEFYKKEAKVKINLDREIAVMKELTSCEFVVKLLNVEEKPSFGVYLTMEICDCDLEDFLKSNQISEYQFKKFLRQLSIAVKAMHDKHIVHRDLKPQNILLKFLHHGAVSDSQDWDIKLADFGYSRSYKALERDGLQKVVDMESLAGTPVFMAPEALYCVMYPGGSYDHTVDIWSVGALIYKVLVGKCGFFASIQDILGILQKKGDSIAFTKRPGKPVIYINEFPPEVEDILNVKFKERILWLIKECLKVEPELRITYDKFHQVVDDLVQSKLTIISVHSGLENKIKFETDNNLKFSDLQDRIASCFQTVPRKQLILWECAQIDSAISDQISLQEFLRFCSYQSHGGSFFVEPKLYLLDIDSLQSIDPPSSLKIVFQSVNDLIQSNIKTQELIAKQQTNHIPATCNRLLKELELMAESQVRGLQVFIHYALNSRERFKLVRKNFNEEYNPFLQTVTSTIKQLELYLGVLESLAYNEDASEFREHLKYLHAVKNSIDEQVSEINSDILRTHNALKSDIERAPKLNPKDVVRSIMPECRSLRKETISDQITKAKSLVSRAEAKHLDLRTKIHFQFQRSYQLVCRFQDSTSALLRIKDTLKDNKKLNDVSLKIQDTLISIMRTARGPQNLASTSTSQGEQEIIRKYEIKIKNIERNYGLLEQERDSYSSQFAEIQKQLAIDEASATSAENTLSKAELKIKEYTAWITSLEGTLGLKQAIETAEPDLPGPLIGLPDKMNSPTIGSRLLPICSQLEHILSRCNTDAIEQVRGELERKLLQDNINDPFSVRIKVANFHNGDFILFLPTKAVGNYPSVPKAFSIDNQQYFLGKESYPEFKLKEGQSLSTWLIGQITSEPRKEQARHICQYPAGRTGTDYHVVEAIYVYTPKPKPIK